MLPPRPFRPDQSRKRRSEATNFAAGSVHTSLACLRQDQRIHLKLKLNLRTNLRVFTQVDPTGLLSTLNDPIYVAIARQLHFKGTNSERLHSAIRVRSSRGLDSIANQIILGGFRAEIALPVE